MATEEEEQGLRIPEIVDELGDPYGPEAIDEQPDPPYTKPLYCGRCRVLVSARRGNAANPKSKSSHYALFPGRKHKADCAYDLKRRGEDLASGSNGTVVREDGQWRLICPPIEIPGASDRPPIPGPARPGRAGGGSGPRPTSRKAGPAIASARRIVQLLQDFRHDPEVVKKFRAVAPGGQHSIAWGEFCYGRTEAHDLARALLDGSARTIPYAVWGPVNKAYGVKRDWRTTYVVTYTAAYPIIIDSKSIRVRVAVRSRNPDWIGAHTESGMLLGYGYWKLLQTRAEAFERGWIELQLWANEPWQNERWDTDDSSPNVPIPIRRAAPRPDHVVTPTVAEQAAAEAAPALEKAEPGQQQNDGTGPVGAPTLALGDASPQESADSRTRDLATDTLQAWTAGSRSSPSSGPSPTTEPPVPTPDEQPPPAPEPNELPLPPQPLVPPKPTAPPSAPPSTPRPPTQDRAEPRRSWRRWFRRQPR
ncbi:hypothetical protein [Streptomyces cavernicola]|uniref:Uncharacterized protein n=1 Tax=Streptomyces cavernicola TaxID=3043613 RepID=A0ABT6SJI7_9ACTN|nr:hypothetical protein [Streptomyces sp. B-S-A6]MDI3408363.1 hypothetical protein [Streptomyces sp. B-S-A6]